MPVRPWRVPAPVRGTDSGRAFIPSQLQPLLVDLANVHRVLADMTARLVNLQVVNDKRAEPPVGSAPVLAIAIAVPVVVTPGHPGRPRRRPFAPLLRQFPIQMGLTQEQVAEQVIELARVHEQVELPATAHTVARHERGVRFPSPIYRRQYRRL